MKRLQLLLVVLFFGGLCEQNNATSNVTTSQAQGDDNVPSVKRIPLSKAKVKEVMEKVLFLADDSVHSARNISSRRNIGRTVKSLTGNYTLGNARVMERKGVKTEQICSGFHFKPWLVMTAASCVHDRTTDGLAVEVTYYDFTLQKFMRTYVSVVEKYLDPHYKPGQQPHNRAFLLLNAGYSWEVEEFSEVHDYLSSQYLSTQNTFVDLWIHDKKKDDYDVQTVQRKVTTDHTKCGELDTFVEWFCVQKTDGKETLNKYDIGSPLYYYHGHVKRVAAFYSGWKIEETKEGHLYNSLHPSIDWIEMIIADHPTPPFV